ncbi:DNA mismatch repair protein MutS [Halosquirtibacter xylanolyticus]|uniref:DNA mismatch repair protein MutS n=1 Tax=Halosquirtibacter xylanolyticus TaxID=3374599 RepID=UPI003749E778|nr:DNA mismatch repair protein MutS [Prolixibacteraceae bacterium]
MAKQKKYVETPLMKQYYSIKAKHPDAILLFRVGDFYETFGEDAIKGASILGITLTKRANGAASFVELAGFPHHSLDVYLPKLVRAGQRVAICEQLEDPKTTKKIVKRGITELVTPGVSIDDNVLNHKENNFLASLYFTRQSIGVSFLDISTGEFLAAEGDKSYIDKLISSFKPKEILFPKEAKEMLKDVGADAFYTYGLDDWVYNYDNSLEKLTKHFQTNNLKGFGIDTLHTGIIAAGAILCYLDLTQHHQVQHISSIARIEEDKYVWLDKFTIHNLELFGSLHEGAKTLIHILDKTITPMGARMMRRWVALPLKNVEAINHRLEVVKEMYSNDGLQDEIDYELRKIADLERIISKVAVGRINPREVVQLKNALEAIEPIIAYCKASGNETLQSYADQLNPCTAIKERISKEIVAEPPVLLNKGSVIADGISDELDELRSIAFSGKDYLQRLQQRESEETGIPSLKIGFNNVFGYYIEVRNTHKDKVPETWIRKQTLVSAERYITEELKEYESKILGAEEKIAHLELTLYNKLIFALSEYIQAIQLNANILSCIDCLSSFAKVSTENEYNCPEVNDTLIIDIKEGRHPVIEQQLPIGESYITNNIRLDNNAQQIMMITGPNMSGKSALLRQTALITLMAQVGCFVPASEAKIGVVDKIFTRVGASDNISMGESTFMVEMNEAASILNNISQRSLILFDELGRGTSTYDGISIAWSIVEYIHQMKDIRAKTLFATHYHELNEMETSFERIKNYNVSIKESGNQIIFLRKLERGGSNHSFGIHVAKLAGMPKTVVDRANKILVQLESKTKEDVSNEKTTSSVPSNMEGDYQLSIFQLDDPVLEQIREQIKNTDINNLTPMEALNKLDEIKKISGL